MKHRKISIYAVILSLIFWLAESVIHRFIFSEAFELIPSELNELWMRSVIFVLIIGFGLFADNQANKIVAAESEKHEIFVATVSSTQHILNNLLNQLQLIFFDVDKAHKLSDQTRTHLEQSIRESKEHIDKLSAVAELDAETIKESVRPK